MSDTDTTLAAAWHAPRVVVAVSSERDLVSRRIFAGLARFQLAAGHRPALRCDQFRVRHSECPNGASSFSPGLARQRRAYPGSNALNSNNPEWVVSDLKKPNAATTPLGLSNPFGPVTQGSFATLGWRPESRWDSQIPRHACDFANPAFQPT
jgi:hypothetical protein